MAVSKAQVRAAIEKMYSGPALTEARVAWRGTPSYVFDSWGERMQDARISGGEEPAMSDPELAEALAMMVYETAE